MVDPTLSTVHRTDAYLRPPPPYEPVASRIKYVFDDIVRGQLIITTGFVGYFGSKVCTLIFDAVFVELNALSNPLFNVIMSVGPIYSTLDEELKVIITVDAVTHEHVVKAAL